MQAKKAARARPRIQVGVSSVTVERRALCEGVRAHRHSVAQRRTVLILVVGLWLKVVVHQ